MVPLPVSTLPQGLFVTPLSATEVSLSDRSFIVTSLAHIHSSVLISTLPDGKPSLCSPHGFQLRVHRPPVFFFCNFFLKGFFFEVDCFLKSSLSLLRTSLLLYVLAWPRACGIPAPQPAAEPCTPSTGRQNLNYRPPGKALSSAVLTVEYLDISTLNINMRFIIYTPHMCTHI